MLKNVTHFGCQTVIVHRMDIFWRDGPNMIKMLDFGQKIVNLPIFFIFPTDEPREVHTVR